MDDNLLLITINGPGNIRPNIIAAESITTVAAIVAVGLRFYARRMSKTKLWWDDWLALVALMTSMGQVGVSGWSIYTGLGRYVGPVTVKKLRTMLIIVFAVELLWCVALIWARCSVIMLYQRLFTQRWLKRAGWALFGINTLWIIAEATFNAINVAIDVGVLALPLYVCWRLNTNLATKLLLTSVFTTGLLVMTAAAVRFRYIANLEDTSVGALNTNWIMAQIGMWAVVEDNLAVTCACLPCLKPLIAKLVLSVLVPQSLRKKQRKFISFSGRPRVLNAAPGLTSTQDITVFESQNAEYKRQLASALTEVSCVDTHASSSSDGRPRVGHWTTAFSSESTPWASTNFSSGSGNC